MNTGGTRDMLCARDEHGRVRDPVPRRRRRVPVGDRRVRRPRAARHDVPRALRRDLAARPADLGARRARPMRSAIRSCRSTATCGRARTCWSSSRRGSVSRVHATRTARASSRDYSDFIVRFERVPGIGFLAGWRGEDGDVVAGRRAQSRSSGRRTRRTSRSSRYHAAGVDALAPPRQSRLPRVRRGRRLHRRGRADHHADLVGAAAEIPPRGAGAVSRPAAGGRRPTASGSRAISIRCRSGIRRWSSAGSDDATSIRSPRSRSGR